MEIPEGETAEWVVAGEKQAGGILETSLVVG